MSGQSIDNQWLPPFAAGSPKSSDMTGTGPRHGGKVRGSSRAQEIRHVVIEREDAELRIANRHQFGKPLSTFQTVAAQLAEVYIASRTIDLASTSVIWRLGARGGDAPDVLADLDVLGYWITSQAPRVMQICHHLHGGMGMDITYPMHRYYSTIKDLTRLLGGPSHRLDLVGAQCSSN